MLDSVAAYQLLGLVSLRLMLVHVGHWQHFQDQLAPRIISSARSSS